MTSAIRFGFSVLLVCVGLALGGCDFFTATETRVDRAEAHIAAGDYRAALIELRKALQDDPQHARSRLLLADTEFRMGDLATAEADLKRAVEAGAPPTGAASLHARLALALGRHEELLVSLAAGELELPQPTRSIVTGRALLASRKPAEALAAFESAIAAEPASIEALVGAAEARADLGNVDRALMDLEAITAREPNAAPAWLMRGQLLLQKGQPAEADEALGQALQHAVGRLTEIERMKALAGRVEAALALGRLDHAAEMMVELGRRAPGAPLVRLLDARLSIARKDFDAASRVLQGLVQDLPGVPAVRFLLGSTLMAQGSLNQAELHLAAVVRSSPDNLEARKLLAEVRLRTNRPEAAMEVLTPALQGSINDPQAEALMSAAQIGAGADPTAIARLERSVQQSPGDLTARLSLASVYLAGGKSDLAVQLLRETPPKRGDTRREEMLLRALAMSQGADAAGAEGRRLVLDNPQDVELLNLASEYLLVAKDVEAASAALESALVLQPGHVPSMIRLAKVKLLGGDLDGAEGVLRRVLSRDASNIDARLGMAEIAGRRGRTDDAKRWLEEVRATDTQAIGSRLMLARLYLADKDTAKADKVIEEIASSSSGRPAVLAAIGSLLLDTGQFERALGEFRKAADLEPDRASHWIGMARAQSALGYAPGARESVDRAVSLDPNSVPVASLAALLDIKDGHSDRALERALSLRKRFPKLAGAAMLEGDVRSAMGQHAGAAEAYAQAARLEPQLAPVVRQVQSRQLAGEKDPTAPLAAWLRDRPDDTQARSILAVMLHGAGQSDRALVEYERVLASGRPNAVLANNLAWLYFERGDARAEALARQAHELAPDNASVTDTLGWILLQKGKAVEGLGLLEQAANQAPDSPGIQLHYAEALAQIGRPKEALAVLDRILASDRPFDRRNDAEALRARLGA